MKFLVDENIPRPLKRLIEEHGHEVVSSPKGTPDSIIFERSNKEKLVLISFDTDFLDTAAFPLAKTPGRIVLRIFPTIFAFQRERLDTFLIEILPTLEVANRLIILSATEAALLEE